MTKRTSIVTTLLASTLLAGLVAGASAQELVTADRIGLADAPKSMTFRTNPPIYAHQPDAEPGRGVQAAVYTVCGEAPRLADQHRVLHA